MGSDSAVDGYWAFDKKIGEWNLDIEMYPDVVKIALGCINFLGYYYVPEIANGIVN